MMVSASRGAIISRILAAIFGCYAFVWGVVALGVAALHGAGVEYHAAEQAMMMLAFLLFHSIISVITTTLQALRVSYDYISTKLSYEIVVMSPMWLFTHVIFWLSFASFLILPTIWEAK